MKIIIYHNQVHTLEKTFQNSINFPKNCEVVFTENCDAFLKSSRCCFSGETIIVFAASNSDEMACLEVMMKTLSDIKLIIKVPLDDPELFSKALTLCPSFIDQEEDSYHNILLVLKKILQSKIGEKQLVKNKGRHRV